MHLHRGHIFHLAGRPDVADAPAALVEHVDGGLAVDEGGVVRWCGEWSARPRLDGPSEVTEHADCFILPGFVDTHVHFPQVNAIDSYGGGQLLDWLTKCIFPAESKLGDEAFALGAAREFCERLATAGTTTSLVFGSQFPHAQDALFEEYRRRGLRGIAGRTVQTTGPPSAAALITDEERAIALCQDEIERWHPLDEAERRQALTSVALVPRFSLAVTTRTLAALGELYSAYRDRGVHFTSHLSENNRPSDGEVAQVRMLFGVQDYLDTYDGRFLPGSERGGDTLLGRRSILAHGVWCTDRELARLHETQTSIAHCPNSQNFLGSGTMPWHRTVGAGVNVSCGTDFCAGDSWFLPFVLNVAFKAHISNPADRAILHPAQLLFLATVAGARALDLEERIGNFDRGREADFVVIDPTRWPSLHHSLVWGGRTDDPVTARDARLFTLLMNCNQVCLKETWVRGRRVHPGAA